MRFAGRPSWSIAVDEPHNLLIALFVRDAAGLQPDTDPVIPALTPAVATNQTPAAATGPAASAQWAGWWTRLLDADHLTPVATPPDFPQLADSPDLQQILRACYPDAIRWSASRQREHVTFMTGSNRRPVAGDVVREIERSLGRPARPFELRVTVLPLTGTHAWRVDPQHLIVTRALFTDTTAYRTRLHTVVEDLA
jgi:hypothetical protein